MYNMSIFAKRTNGRNTPPLIIEDTLININDIVEKYFVLNDSIKYYDTNLGTVYRSIYEKFTKLTFSLVCVLDKNLD
jgi:hypothetical protein